MAWHPDDFYDDLEKIISYCDENVEKIDGLSDDYNRLFIYLPIVILGGDLYLSTPGSRSINLKKVDFGYYMHFGIKEDQQTLALVVFVTEKYLLKFFEKANTTGRLLGKHFSDSIGEKPK